MKVLYFAWLRQRVGVAEETVDLPDDVATVGAMLTWLRERSDAHATALADLSVVRVAVNQDYARDGDPVANHDEVALFPPVTGG
ncbi:MAG: molybdopterin converting factor subunit 1 [Alphaproteobacteria bacterium]|nr:molybdopterin converting factor subunit 1 [Alphaproteobacteria bacterium]